MWVARSYCIHASMMAMVQRKDLHHLHGAGLFLVGVVVRQHGVVVLGRPEAIVERVVAGVGDARLGDGLRGRRNGHVGRVPRVLVFRGSENVSSGLGHALQRRVKGTGRRAVVHRDAHVHVQRRRGRRRDLPLPRRRRRRHGLKLKSPAHLPRESPFTQDSTTVIQPHRSSLTTLPSDQPERPVQRDRQLSAEETTSQKTSLRRVLYAYFTL